MLRISFVIPAYNVEQYIEECVNSLTSLPLKKDEYEIIIINDGSTDNTLSICRNLEIKHKMVKVISNKNHGVSYSRNIGIKHANGNYICFVDGDDYHINDGIVKILITCEENNIDIGRGKYVIYKENECIQNNNNVFRYYNKILSAKYFLCETIKNKDNEIVPWLGVFKTELLKSNNIFFDPLIAYEEDQIFFLRCLLAERCTVIQTNDYFYGYRHNPNSATKKFSIRQIDDVIKVVELEEEQTIIIKDKRFKKAARKYQSASFYQLTSIYGRIDKQFRKDIRKKITLSMKLRCMFHPYDFHQFIKIFLFTFCIWFVDLFYDIKLN